jgi:CPA2 family monovalent cation:H+ antiporter-2
VELYYQIGISFAVIALFARLAKISKSFFAPFYILAGILVGPFALGIVTNKQIIGLFADIGVVFLLFYLGFEFSFNRLIKHKKVMAIAGSVDFLINFSIGLLIGCIIGLDLFYMIALAGIIYMSSSGIITKTLIQLKAINDPEGELIMGIMIFEDLVMVFFLVFITTFSDFTGKIEWTVLGIDIGLALVFALVLVVIGKKYHKYIDLLLKSSSQEVVYLSFLGLVFIVTTIGMKMGVSEALGAFFLGLAVAESDHCEGVETLAVKFRDIFGSMFFFYFGLNFQLNNLDGIYIYLLIGIVLSIMGKMISSLFISSLLNHSKERGLLMGLITVSRGEFSLLIAGIVGNEVFNFQAFSIILILSTALFSSIGFRLSKVLCKKQNLCLLPQMHLDKEFFN